MTQARRDAHSTEFGLWLRDQPEIDSALGFVASNIDYIWANYKTGDWMLIEEKRFNKKPKFYQSNLFKKMDAACRGADGYFGFHTIIFEKTSPDDGWIELDDKRVTPSELLAFLRFGA